MASVKDLDRNFLGVLKSSTPKNLLQEGEISRLINGRFVEGTVSNSLPIEEFNLTFNEGNNKKLFASNVTFGELLTLGDIQLSAPLDTFGGQYLVLFICGFIFLADLHTCIVYDITPLDSFLPESSKSSDLSYLDNGGGVYGVGGYLVVFNYPNRPIFINDLGARVSDPNKGEMPVARLGATAGNRAFIITGDNILLASDPLGGASSMAPLTFHQILDGSTGFTGQSHTIGSALNMEYVTCAARLPKFLGPSQEFLAQNLLISTTRSKYIIAAGEKREDWPNVQFITYAGSSEGIAGPLAATNVGDNLLYTSTAGRQKSISQDQNRETGMVETFLDDPLGQYLCCGESSYQHRDWYETLNHTRSVLKFNKNKLFATVYPMKVPALGRNGEKLETISHRALATASMDSKTRLGSQAAIAWEGFYDWINPVSIVTLKDNTYIVSKDLHGRNRFYKVRQQGVDAHSTTVVTRGYFSQALSKSKSFLKGDLTFRKLSGPIGIKVSYLSNDKWICAHQGQVTKKHYQFTSRDNKIKTRASSIPLKIDLEHSGCRFELETVVVNGEAHEED